MSTMTTDNTDRNQTTAEARELKKRIVRANLIELFSREPNAKSIIAKECYIGASSVTRWISENSPSIPNAEYLEIIAKHFKVSMEWIMSDHTVHQVSEFVTTYYDAFRALIPLIDNDTVELNELSDCILIYLLSEYFRIRDNDSIPEEKKIQWISRVEQEFRLPLPDRVAPEFWTELILREKLDDIDIFQRYVNLAKLVGDNAQMEWLRQTISNEGLDESYRE